MGRIKKQAITGVLVGDQRLDQILLLRDLDGDGTANGEATVFFDGSNASGLQNPTKNVFSITQAADGSVFYGDGSTDAVYRLTDHNGDGNARGKAEAQIWFSADNAGGLSTVTPNGIAQGGDGAIYIANAGVRSRPQDAIYRTVDLNGDGDADDAGEATVWLDVQMVIDTAVPFDLSFDGNVAYLNDLTGYATDAIYRIEDLDGSGDVSRDEVTTFISDDMNFGAPVDISNAVGVGGSVYTGTWFNGRSGEFKVYRLTDLDGSGQIDSADEAVEVWNQDAMVGGSAAEIGFSLAADEDGRVLVTANSFARNSTVLSLEDLNGDGDFLDAGETILFGSDAYGGQLVRARAVATYEDMADPVSSTVGAGNHFSIFLKDGVLYSAGENMVGQLGNGEIGFDVKAPFAVDMPEGFHSTIVSVSAGLLHSTFLTHSGEVYAFGFNNRGPLGVGDEETRTQAVKVTGLDHTEVIAIENGNATSFAITHDGALYAWGTNSNGQLGLGDRAERHQPEHVQALSGENVVAVASDVSHTLVLTADGDVYAMGRNMDHQVSNLTTSRVLEPRKVEGLPSDVMAVSAAGRTSYAVTSDGRVFGWGQSDKGQLLQGADNGDGTFTPNTADVKVPVELTSLPENVVDVQGGARWAVALTKDGDVFAWGPNDEGPTGGLDGDPAAESAASFHPTKIAALDAVNIVEIQTGPNSILAVADDGRVFSWGSNSDGRLGYDSEGSVYAPQEVVFGADFAPWLLTATPGDNHRDVQTDAAIELTFTKPVQLGNGTLTLVNRDTGERMEIDVNNALLVQTDGAHATITPPEPLQPGARYAVEISEGAFLDSSGKAYEGIALGDTVTFNFQTSEQAADSGMNLYAGRDDDLVRGGARNDLIFAREGNNILSGGEGDDHIVGGRDNDTIFGGNGNDSLAGGRGDDVISGGNGNDYLRGNGGLDTFVYQSGHDTVRDFEKASGWGRYTTPSETIEIHVEGIENYADLLATASHSQRSVTFTFDDDNSLTISRVGYSELNADMFTFG